MFGEHLVVQNYFSYKELSEQYLLSPPRVRSWRILDLMQNRYTLNTPWQDIIWLR